MRKYAIIGSGPRGLSVLERFCVVAAKEGAHAEIKIYLIDDGYIGTGRIWRINQGVEFIMNTPAQEITAFSGPGSCIQARPGAGPSFAQWWQEHYNDYDKYRGYAPRQYYGEYMRFVFQVIRAHLPAHVQLLPFSDRAVDIEEQEHDGGQVIFLKSGGRLEVDATVIASGHARNKLVGTSLACEKHAQRFSGLTFIRGDSANEFDLSKLKPNQPVGVLGMGLSFYDVMAALTEGRGGFFQAATDGELSYVASGQEPKIFCGSRSGVPILARGVNEKPFDYVYNCRLFTVERVNEARQRSAGQLDFGEQIWPLIEAEVNLVYIETLIKTRYGELTAARFSAEVERQKCYSAQAVVAIAKAFVSEVAVLDLAALAQPFAEKVFHSSAAYLRALTQFILQDIAEADKGNLTSPLKTALDVLRNIRGTIRKAVDFGGLNADSHREFLQKYAPIIAFLCTGPAVFRSRQLLALIDAGIVHVIGPAPQVHAHDNGFELVSEAVTGSSVAVNALIEARIPNVNLALDESELMQALTARGLLRNYVNTAGGIEFVTGGVAVTDSPFNAIRADGTVAERIFVLGIPTENVRWFMQSGASRSSHWIDFMFDADAIARAMLALGSDERRATLPEAEYQVC